MSKGENEREERMRTSREREIALERRETNKEREPDNSEENKSFFSLHAKHFLGPVGSW